MYILILLISFTVIGVQAQSSFSVEYAMGFGSGNTKTYMTSPSFRGIIFEYKRYVKPNLSVGGEFGWNAFYERRAFDTYTVGTASYSGVQYHYINATPILATVGYHFKSGEKLNPFVGLGIGTLYLERKTDMGLWTTSVDDWHFALKPELGVLVNTGPDMDILLSGKYFYGFQTNDVSAQSYFTFNIGMVFKKGM